MMFVKVRQRGRRSRDWVGTVFTELGKVLTTDIVRPPRGFCCEGAVYPSGDRVLYSGCDHPEWAHVIRETRPWSVPITDNRAAHGNITDKVECTECGAYRFEEINGSHIGKGPWMVPQRVLDAIEEYDKLYQEILIINREIMKLRKHIEDRLTVKSHRDYDKLAELEKELGEKRQAIKKMRV